MYFHRKKHRDNEKIFSLWFNDQAAKIMKGVFMLSSRIDKLFYKYDGFNTWKCVEKVYINIVDLSLVESVRIPYMKKITTILHFGFMWFGVHLTCNFQRLFCCLDVLDVQCKPYMSDMVVFFFQIETFI